MDFFWETTSGFISVFSASWFDIGYMFLPVYGGFSTRILRSILVLVSLFPKTAQCLSSMLGPQWYMLCVSLLNFMFFLRE